MEKEKIGKTVVAEPEQEQIITVAPGNIRTHLQEGKAHFEAGRYQEAKD